MSIDQYDEQAIEALVREQLTNCILGIVDQLESEGYEMRDVSHIMERELAIAAMASYSAATDRPQLGEHAVEIVGNLIIRMREDCNRLMPERNPEWN